MRRDGDGATLIPPTPVDGSVPAPAVASEDYLQAFMSGFDFVLLAIRGRMQEADLPEAERARLEAFLADYWRISRAFHERTDAPAPVPLALTGPVRAEVPPAMAN